MILCETYSASFDYKTHLKKLQENNKILTIVPAFDHNGTIRNILVTYEEIKNDK